MNVPQPIKIKDKTLSQGSMLLIKWLKKRFKKNGVSLIQLVLEETYEVHIGLYRSNIAVPTVKINSPLKTLTRSSNGLLGWAEAYIEGNWSTPNLHQVIHWAMANEALLERIFVQNTVLLQIQRLFHWLNRNNKHGSRRNIAAHYNLGNNFYQLWLDSTMTYSSAIFKNSNDTIGQAQNNKYLKVIDLMDINTRHSILEIGCGWGGFARTLNTKFNNHYHGITLSKPQCDYANQHSITPYHTFSYSDYRDISGKYDRILSIEMIEAIGERNWPIYFRKIYDSLKNSGVAVIQTILINDHRFDTYRKQVDFIQRYIFPGGMLPSLAIFKHHAYRTGFYIEECFSFGKDYSKTLILWHEQFIKAWPSIKKLGFDDRFKRMWKYYLLYCQAGFHHKAIDVCLFKLCKHK